jgi:hypothetical protein
LTAAVTPCSSNAISSISEDLFRTPLEVLPRVSAFLGVDPAWQPAGPARRDNETARRFQLPVLVRHGVKVASEAGVYRHVPRWAKETVRVVSQRRSQTMPEARISPTLRAGLLAELDDDLQRLHQLTGERLFP